jgi:hypothetical protein
MAAPSPAPEKFEIRISPATADVNANAVCHFTVDPSGTDVHWAIKPEIGNIDQHGVYQAPPKITMPQTVIVTATATSSGQIAIAAI